MTEAHETFPNKFEACFLIAALIALELIAFAGLADAGFLDGLDSQGTSGLVTVVGNGLLFSILMTYKRLGYRSLFHSSGASVGGTVTILTIPLLLIVPGMVELTAVLNGVVTWIVPPTLDDEIAYAESMAPEILPIFFAVIVAPLLEEMLFRGVILRSFLRQYSRLEAILWSALLFAIAHLNPYQFFTAITLGIVQGWLYERTRSLWPCILLHAMFNAYVTFAVNAADALSGAWLLAGASLAAISGGVILVRLLGARTQVR